MRAERVAGVQVAHDLDLARGHDRTERVGDGGIPRLHAVVAHHDAAVGDRHPLGVELRAAGAELREHPAPVRVLAVERALHELRARPPAGRRAGRPRTTRRPTTWSRTSFAAPSASRAICSASEPHTSVSASVNAAACSPPSTPDRAVGEDEHRVVRAHRSVDDQRAERVARGREQRLVQRGRIDHDVGGDDREHRGHRRAQHRRALGHPPDEPRRCRAPRPRPPCARCRW